MAKLKFPKHRRHTKTQRTAKTSILMDNKPEKRTRLNLLVTNTVFFSLFFIFIWNIDISVTALINNMALTNGFFSPNPMITYHVSLYGLILTFVITAYYNIHFGKVYKCKG